MEKARTTTKKQKEVWEETRRDAEPEPTRFAFRTRLGSRDGSISPRRTGFARGLLEITIEGTAITEETL
jgi:hypothetical protein